MNLLRLAVSCLVAAAACTPQAGQDLVAAFENPPQEAKPVIIWQWMDGWVTKEGITHDLEAFAASHALSDLFAWKAIALAAVIWVLTNLVKQTKKLHPLAFIALSAVVGIVFRFGGG